MRPSASAWRAAAASTSSRLCVGTSVMLLVRPARGRIGPRAAPAAPRPWPSRSAAPAPPAKVHARSRLDVHTTAFEVPAHSPSAPASTQCRSTSPLERARGALGQWCPRCLFWLSFWAEVLRYWRRTALRRGPVAVPSLGMRAGVANQRRRTGFDGLHHLRQQRQAHVPGPGKTLHAFGQQHLHLQRVLSMRPCTSSGLARRGARGGRAGTSVASASRQVAQRGRHAPTPAGAGSSPTGAPAPVAPARRVCCPPARAIRPPPPAARWPGVSRASARASSSDTLSGVVTSTVGRRRSCAARSPLAVSPVRRPLLQCGPGRAGVLAGRAASRPPARAWA